MHDTHVNLDVVRDQDLLAPEKLSLQIEYLLSQLSYLGRVGVSIDFWRIFNVTGTTCIFE
jgi:hypothetical protein